jgi:hypothetical protein
MCIRRRILGPGGGGGFLCLFIVRLSEVLGANVGSGIGLCSWCVSVRYIFRGKELTKSLFS